MKTRTSLTAVATALVATAGLATSSHTYHDPGPGGGSQTPIALAAPVQEDAETVDHIAALAWHPQSGNEGEVGEGAEANLERDATGISYEITTHSLNPGHAYSVWLVVVNDPASCADSPCAAPDFLDNAEPDAQVAAEVPAGPLLDGWLQVQGLDDPMGAEIHLVLNDHGPVIDELAEEMVSTYRAGCSDDSPFPEIFPEAAIADGTPGPNTCTLIQSVVFLPPS